MLVLLIFLLLNSCSTFQAVSESPLEPVVENKIREINSSTTMTPKEKESTIAVLESQKNENKTLRANGQDTKNELASCQEELKDVTENAGKYQ